MRLLKINYIAKSVVKFVLLAVFSMTVIAAPGDPVGVETQVNEYIEGAQTNPGIVMDADGEYFIVWQDGNEGNNGQDGSAGGVFSGFIVLVA